MATLWVSCPCSLVTSAVTGGCWSFRACPCRVMWSRSCWAEGSRETETAPRVGVSVACRFASPSGQGCVFAVLCMRVPFAFRLLPLLPQFPHLMMG